MPYTNDTIMDEKDFSCIEEVTKTVHIALPSSYVSDEINVVAAVLENWKQQFVKQLQGFVVSFKNVSLISNSGFLVIDKPFVHYDVKATFELFCPFIGSFLKGKINRIGHEHIRCLVHNINVTVDRPSCQSNDVSQFIAFDYIILFQITHIKYNQRAIHIKGAITDECVSLMKKLPYFSTQNNAVETCISTSEQSEATKVNECQNASSKSENNLTEEQSSLLQSNCSHLNKSNVLIQNVTDNFDNMKSKLSNFHASCFGESNSSSKISASLSTQFSISQKKNKKSKKYSSGNVCENLIGVNNQITALSSNLDSLSQKKTKKHKEGKEKSSETVEYDVKIFSASNKKKKRKQKSYVSGNIEKDLNSKSKKRKEVSIDNNLSKKKIKTEDISCVRDKNKHNKGEKVKEKNKELKRKGSKKDKKEKISVKKCKKSKHERDEVPPL